MQQDYKKWWLVVYWTEYGYGWTARLQNEVGTNSLQITVTPKFYKKTELEAEREAKGIINGLITKGIGGDNERLDRDCRCA